MKVFLDTNVLVSATATRGLCADVFRLTIEHYQLVISEHLLTELERTLRTKFRAPKDLIDDTIWLLRQDTLLAAAEPLVSIDLKHRGDRLVLSAAINGGADVFITGDHELLELGKLRGVAVLSPRQFWEKERGQQGARRVQ
jgi:putative PIN family toxin of toxin-antitoxin system